MKEIQTVISKKHIQKKVTATYADEANENEKNRKCLEDAYGQMDKLKDKIELLTKANVAVKEN